MQRRTLLAAACSLLGSVLVAAAPSARPAHQDGVLAEPVEPVVVFLVRHAEKGDDDARDPGLSAAGERRANELARVLGSAGVTHLFASEYKRTQNTLRPLADAVGHEVEVVSARTPEKQLAAIADLPPGSVAVICGHSNTTPQLAARLVDPTGSDAANLGEDEYDRLFEVVLPARSRVESSTRLAPKLVELRYGAGE
ncbi:MAG: phosphoglycerate mutase family protein [Planctomycetota bacterium]